MKAKLKDLRSCAEPTREKIICNGALKLYNSMWLREGPSKMERKACLQGVERWTQLTSRKTREEMRSREERMETMRGSTCFQEEYLWGMAPEMTSSRMW